jgi:DNA-binding transcriptional regulator YhcF (GntR family)
MQLTLDHRSPVPLYHQLSEAIRYRIATGELKSGTVLPPLRRAAETWGVNLHTVRRAYAELARAGVVATHAPEGTRVLPGGAEIRGRPAPGSRERFLQSVLAEARLRHHLSADELIASLRRMKGAPPPRAVSVVECSLTQCEDLAGQIEERWKISARPWSLDRTEPPPAGLVIATYFHYNDVRLRWPDRLPDVRFLAISPEADLARRLLGGHRGAPGRKTTVILCEREEAMARNITADLVRILPAPDFRVVTKVVPKAVAALGAAGRHAPLLLSPRMWGELPERARRDPRIHQVRYTFDSAGLASLGAEQKWEPR